MSAQASADLADRHRMRAVVLAEIQALLPTLGLELDPLQSSQLNDLRMIAEDQARAATALAEADCNAREAARPREVVPGSFSRHGREVRP